MLNILKCQSNIQQRRLETVNEAIGQKLQKRVKQKKKKQERKGKEVKLEKKLKELKQEKAKQEVKFKQMLRMVQINQRTYAKRNLLIGGIIGIILGMVGTLFVKRIMR